jgi:two-component system, NarL family, invasion response regulator UvrY
MIKILIADDHSIVREGLKYMLMGFPEMVVAGEASNGQEVLDILRLGEKWDVVVLDISMPGKTGIEILQEIKQQYPKLPVLILSMHPEEQFAIRCLKAGASGYVGKQSVSVQLVEAIRKVHSGGKFLSPDLAERLAYYVEKDSDRPLHEMLSNREFQVMRLLAGGKTVTEIANELSLSVKTVSTYRTHILEKMDMKTNADLVQYAMQNRLLE